MVRTSRIVIPDTPHHVTHRGNRREPVFFSQDDLELYLSLCLKYFCMHRLKISAYCLMKNHVHFIAVPQYEQSLSKAIGITQMRYSQLLNKKNGWTGHLWSNRFISTPLDWDHFRAAVRYSERNPVRARIVLRAEEYRWSSARSHVFGEKDPLLSREALFGLDEEVGDWSAWLNDDDDIEEIDRLRDSTKTGRPCGSASFLETVETRTGRNFTKKKRGPKRRAKPEK